jgi:uncharacterized protein YutE (UPF0331/DUF86 family)
MVFSNAFVLKKLDTLSEYSVKLKKLASSTTDKEFSTNEDKLYSAERLLQLIVDCMLDINQHFIKEKEVGLPNDLQSTFTVLGENNVLPKELADRLAPVTGLRNLLVHQYEKIDSALFLKNMRENLDDFDEYRNSILGYIEQK